MSKIAAAKSSLTVIVVGMLAISTVFGDDLPHLARPGLEIHSETLLSGVDVRTGTIGDLIQELGKPRHFTVSHNNELTHVVFVDGTYEWQTKNWRLRIRVRDELNSARITQVDVWGRRSDAHIGKTGRGLELGDTISDARRIYGLRSYFGTTLPEVDRQIWAPSPGVCNPILGIDFNEHGNVNHMSLVESCGPYF